MKTLSLLWWVLVVAQPCAATRVAAQVLTLHLVDDAGGAPVDGALVSLLTRTDEAVWSGVSNEDGRLVLTPPVAGEYFIEARRLGYEAYRSPLLGIGEDGELSVELPMRPQPVGLGGFEVVSEVRAAAQLEALGLSLAQLGNRWIDRAEIDAMELPGSPKDVLRWQNIAGLWVDEGAAHGGRPRLCVTIRGSGCALTVLDGAVIDSELAFHLDPRSLEAIAVLRPREAATLFGTQGGNGAVLFWTREGSANQ